LQFFEYFFSKFDENFHLVFESFLFQRVLYAITDQDVNTKFENNLDFYIKSMDFVSRYIVSDD